MYFLNVCNKSQKAACTTVGGIVILLAAIKRRPSQFCELSTKVTNLPSQMIHGSSLKVCENETQC